MRNPLAIVGALLTMFLSAGETCNTPNTAIPTGCPTNPTTKHVLTIGHPTVAVIEYIDLECSHCGAFARDTYPAIKQQYIDTGEVSWEFRHFPISQFHPHAQKAAEASECAHQQDKFFDYIDLVFQNQSNLTNAGLKSLASQLELDRTCFDPCLDSGGESSRVEQDLNAGLAQGVARLPLSSSTEPKCPAK